MNVLMDLFKIQGHMRTVDRADLRVYANRRGAHLTDRQITSLITEKVFPASAQFGGKGGVWPEICVELLAFIGVQRRANTSIDALRQLVPLWVYFERCRRADALDLDELQEMCKGITEPRAGMMLGWMIGGLVADSQHLTVTDGSRGVEEIDLVLTTPNPGGCPHVLTQLRIPVNSKVPDNQTIAMTVRDP